MSHSLFESRFVLIKFEISNSNIFMKIDEGTAEGLRTLYR